MWEMVEGYTAASAYIQDALANLPRSTAAASATEQAKASATAPSFTTVLERELEQVPYAMQAPSCDPQDYPNVSEQDVKKIQETSQQLESLILYQLLKQMWDTIPEGTLFPNSPGEKMYREMWLEQMSGSAVKQGPVLGIAEMVERQLLDRANRTVSLADLAPELAGMQNDLKVDRAREGNPYGYMAGSTPGF
jgi:peptidoglycan hydrolase FlgJ